MAYCVLCTFSGILAVLRPAGSPAPQFPMAAEDPLLPNGPIMLGRQTLTPTALTLK